MKFEGFIGPAYQLESVNVDAQRCVNLYPEVIESGNGKNKYYLKSTPGLTKIGSCGDGPIRGIHVDSLGRIFAVSGDGIYRVTKSTDWKFLVFPKPGVALEGRTPATVNTTSGAFGNYDNSLFWVGMAVKLVKTTGGGLPGLFNDSTTYYITSLPSSKFGLATSAANALAGTALVPSSQGTADFNIVPVYLSTTPLEIKNLAVDYATNTIFKANHGFITNQKIWLADMYTPKPPNPTYGTASAYFTIRIDDDHFQIAYGFTNAINGVPFVLGTAPTGTWSFQPIFAGVDTFTASGTPAVLDTSTGTVKAASFSEVGDGTDCTTLFCDGQTNYLYKEILTASPTRRFGSLASFNEAPGPVATHITWIDGYFILNEVGTNRFWVSNLQSFVIDGLSFSSSEGDPDLVVGLIADQRNLYILNEKTTEVYVNTGNSDFPFERIQAGFAEMGCLAKYSIAKIDQTFLFLGRSNFGSGQVFAAQSLNFQRISTHALEQAIQSYAAPQNATSYTYEWKGHKFYVLNFAEATWVYDLTTGLWHERAYTTEDGSLSRHRVEHLVYVPHLNLWIGGDYENGNLYLLDDNVFTDDSQAITRLRASPHLSNELKRVFCKSFQLDMEVGMGLDGGGLGSQPTVILDYSNDGGHTWSSESYTIADGQGGAIGQYKTRVLWRRLGAFRDRIFRVKITDPVKVVLIDAQMDIDGGNH